MHIAIIEININMPYAMNLKLKRKILRSLCERLKHKFNISIAEVANLNEWQLASIGIASVSNDAKYLQQISSKILEFVQENEGEYILIDHHIDIIIH